jgi:hypothetical protein
MISLLLPIAADWDRDWVLAVARALELLDDAPLPIGLPITFTRGFETEDDSDPDELVAVDVDPEFAVEFCAWAAPPSIANAVAARRMCLIDVTPFGKAPGADFPSTGVVRDSSFGGLIQATELVKQD